MNHTPTTGSGIDLDKLEPCPFCGSAARFEENYDDNYSDRVACTACPASADVRGRDFSPWNRRATPPQVADAWHQAVLNECMKIEAAYHADDPAQTIKELIDWHAQEASGVAETIKVQADNYLHLTCGSQPDDTSRAQQPVAVDELERLRKALERLENADDEICRLRTSEQYLSMIDGGQKDALLELDNARFEARAALTQHPSAAPQVAGDHQRIVKERAARIRGALLAASNAGSKVRVEASDAAFLVDLLDRRQVAGDQAVLQIANDAETVLPLMLRDDVKIGDFQAEIVKLGRAFRATQPPTAAVVADERALRELRSIITCVCDAAKEWPGGWSGTVPNLTRALELLGLQQESTEQTNERVLFNKWWAWAKLSPESSPWGAWQYRAALAQQAATCRPKSARELYETHAADMPGAPTWDNLADSAQIIWYREASAAPTCQGGAQHPSAAPQVAEGETRAIVGVEGLETLTTYESSHGTLIRLADAKCVVAAARRAAPQALSYAEAAQWARDQGLNVPPAWEAAPQVAGDQAGELAQALADADRVPHMIVFDDAEVKPELVIGATRARYRFKQVSERWNAHLFVKIASNSSDEVYPCTAQQPSVSEQAGELPKLLKFGIGLSHDYVAGYNEAISDTRAALARQAGAPPVDMILHCPKCGLQHIDAPDDRTPDWKNPPHRSHLCHGCGHIWRPADVPTNGVAAIRTVGKDDSPKVAAPAGAGERDAKGSEAGEQQSRKAAAANAVGQNDAELKFNATRLRNVARLVGLESAVPQDDATLDGARGSVLGLIAGKLRAAAASAAGLSPLAALHAAMCAVNIVGEIDGREVVRRATVLDLIDRHRASAKRTAGQDGAA